MKIRINNYDYEIVEVDETEKSFFNENDDLLIYGRTTYEKQLIEIYKDLTPIRKRQTLIHELTHAFFDVYLASQHIKDKFDEEDICCFIASYSEEILKKVNDYF